MQNYYTLKCENISICDVNIENNYITEILEIYQKEYAPVESYISGKIELNKLNDWLSSRAIPVDRDGYNHILLELNIKNNKKYLIDNLALSLSDQYWLKPYDLNINWEDINFFDNNFNDIEYSDAVFGKDNNISSSLKNIL